MASDAVTRGLRVLEDRGKLDREAAMAAWWALLGVLEALGVSECGEQPAAPSGGREGRSVA